MLIKNPQLCYIAQLCIALNTLSFHYIIYWSYIDTPLWANDMPVINYLQRGMVNNIPTFDSIITDVWPQIRFCWQVGHVLNISR